MSESLMPSSAGLTSMTTSWSPKRTHRTGSAACWQLGMWRPPNRTAPAEIWSSYGATGAQKGANVPRPLPAKTAKTSQKTVANRCAYLRFGPHGKEGVGGSSPPEGSAKAPHIGAFLVEGVCRIASMRCVWSPLWSLQVQSARSRASEAIAPGGRLLHDVAALERVAEARREVRRAGNGPGPGQPGHRRCLRCVSSHEAY
jgi:hypothetical protein